VDLAKFSNFAVEKNAIKLKKAIKREQLSLFKLPSESILHEVNTISS
jgi:hypothetical protein